MYDENNNFLYDKNLYEYHIIHINLILLINLEMKRIELLSFECHSNILPLKYIPWSQRKSNPRLLIANQTFFH